MCNNWSWCFILLVYLCRVIIISRQTKYFNKKNIKRDTKQHINNTYYNTNELRYLIWYNEFHRFRSRWRDHFFWVHFYEFWSKLQFLRQLGSSKNWLEFKIEPPGANLTRSIQWNTLYMIMFSSLNGLHRHTQHFCTQDFKHDHSELHRYQWLALVLHLSV